MVKKTVHESSSEDSKPLKEKKLKKKLKRKLPTDLEQLADKENSDSDMNIQDVDSETAETLNESSSENSTLLKEKKVKKKLRKLPTDLKQLADEEESDSDMSIPDADSKPAKTPSIRAAVRQEKFKSKTVSGMKYLLQWKIDRKNWKFNRKIQSQLIRGCLNRHIVTVDNFPHFLEYAPSIKGGSILWLKKLCEEKIQEYDTTLAKLGEDEDVPKDLKTAKKRAKKILDVLNIKDAPAEAEA